MVSELTMDTKVIWDRARMKEVEEAKQTILAYRRKGHPILKSDGTSMERFNPHLEEVTIKAVRTSSGLLKILGDNGDERITWDKENGRQAIEAKDKFEEYLKKGWKAYSVDSKGKKKRQIEEFDIDAEEILMIPPTAAG